MRFERENNTSYLVLEENTAEELMKNVSEKDECGDIEYKMIKNNSIEGLLLVHQRIIDGRSIYYYDITSKQQMSKLYSYAQIRLEDVWMICESIAIMVKNINMYMLDLGKIILEPEYMYVDISEKKVKFVYYPCRQQEKNDCDNGITRLFEYILEHFDHSVEKEQLMTMYMIYQKVVQKEYNLENFNEIVKECSAEIAKEEKIERRRGKTQENNYKKSMEELEELGESEGLESLSEPDKLQIHQRFQEKVSINAVPAENIDDEIEIENDKLLKCQKWIKIISIAMIILGVLKILIPGLIPLPISVTASALIVALGTAVLAGISAIPKEIFVKIQPRRYRQKYEVPLEPYERDTQKYESDNAFENGDNLPEYNLMEEVSQEPQTMLLSDYIKFVGDTSARVKLVSQETREVLEIAKFPCVIGSMKERCDKVIEQKLVSRLHCCISGCADGYYIEDMNSTNGTFVNGKRLAPNNKYILNNGDEVGMATYIYEVEIS